MVKGKIKFDNPDNVRDFVNIVSKCDANVDILYGSIELDGKSIEGLFTIQLNTVLTCVIHTEMKYCSDVINQLSRFVVEDFK